MCRLLEGFVVLTGMLSATSAAKLLQQGREQVQSSDISPYTLDKPMELYHTLFEVLDTGSGRLWYHQLQQISDALHSEPDPYAGSRLLFALTEEPEEGVDLISFLEYFKKHTQGWKSLHLAALHQRLWKVVADNQPQKVPAGIEIIVTSKQFEPPLWELISEEAGNMGISHRRSNNKTVWYFSIAVEHDLDGILCRVHWETHTRSTTKGDLCLCRRLQLAIRRPACMRPDEVENLRKKYERARPEL